MRLTIFATTDIHGALYPYDYFEGVDKSSSLLHLYSHIRRYGKAHPDDIILTVDNGDILQGDVWSDYDYRHSGGGALFAPRMINEVYDAVGIGNHEFNFGLDYLLTACKQVEADIINANVDFRDHPLKDCIKPYVILEKETSEGPLKIGFLSVVPTQIMKWDAFHLEGRVDVEDMRLTVEATAREMKGAGADIIILLSHSGMSKDPEHIRSYGENQTFLMTMIQDIDGIVFGHTHEFFPDPDFELEVDNIDFRWGGVNGKPMVQPGVSASHLGQLTFDLEYEAGWCIKSADANLIESHTIQMDESLKSRYLPEHQQVLDYLSQPIGHTEETWHTYFSRVVPSKAVQVVAEAGRNYALELMDRGEVETLPVLGFNAATKAGRDGAHDFTVIEAGEINLSSAIDLYKHTNTMVLIKVDGTILKEWLEWSASQFNVPGEGDDLLKPNSSKNGFPSYNFDTFFDLKYTFDISQPPRYSGTAKKLNDTERVVEMMYNGKPVQPDDCFIVPANNYRAAYTAFLRKAEVVHESQNSVRDIVTEYMRTGPDFEYKNPMTIIPGGKYRMKTATKAQEYIGKDSNIRHLETIGDGFSWYEIDLTKEEGHDPSQEE
ncbi:5'-nucleotidase C-terminal domain-containing protein [Salinicoccus roseus]|nr:5'-nucleotidase C-terminal domain-containing protein [Salinicoccus roseus]